MNYYRLRIVIYVALIATAPLLDESWLIATQAALGGFMIGYRMEQHRRKMCTTPEKLAPAPNQCN